MIRKSSDHYTQPKSILTLGPPGTGKTTLMCQIPGIFILDCDQNMEGPLKHLRESNNLPEFYIGNPFTDKDDKPLDRSKFYDRSIELLHEAGNMPEVTGFGIDSLTSFVDFVKVKVLVLNNKRPGDFMDISKPRAKIADDKFTYDEWDNFLSIMKQTIYWLKATGKLVVINGHIRTKEDELENILRQYIAVPGAIQEVLAGYFSEVWLLESDTGIEKGKPVQKRIIRTFPQTKATQTLGLKSPSGIESGKTYNAADLIARVTG